MIVSSTTEQQAMTNADVSPRSLAAVAFLKARFDEGADHLGIFMPLILDAAAAAVTDDFSPADLQGLLLARHGLSMPQHTISTLLNRAVKRGVLRKSSGRYARLAETLPPTNIDSARREIDRQHAKLAAALRAHAERRGFDIRNDDDALAIVFEFLEQQQVGLLLDGPPTGSHLLTSERRVAIVAEFIKGAIDTDADLRATIADVLEGMVLYNAAFLPDINDARKRFGQLDVYFDSAIVRQALGYEGEAAQALIRETLDVFKAAGIRCLVFDKTLHEIKRILLMYEHKLGTPEGRRSLRPVPMTRHLLTRRFSPSDVKQMSALLEYEVVGAGLQVAAMPRHEARYTLDEKKLAESLANPDAGDEESPRVVHDVDCVAAALTLRQGRRSSRVEDSRILFVSSTPSVIATIREWFRSEGETGVPPIINVRALSNLAWLKRPTVARNFKVREMVALCCAALKPSRRTWDRFLRHLDGLRKSNAISSDEAAAVVVSELTDTLLMDAELSADDGIAAGTLDDVVERAKASYTAAADAQVARISAERDAAVAAAQGAELRVATANAERDAAVAAERALQQASVAEIVSTSEQLRELRMRVESKARRVAAAVTRTAFAVLGLGVTAGGGLIIYQDWHHFGPLGGTAVALTVTFLGLEVLGVLHHLRGLRHRSEAWLRVWMRRWLTGPV